MSELTATAQDFRRALLAVRDARSTKAAIWQAGVSLLLAQHREHGHAITMARLAVNSRSASETTARSHYKSFAQLVARELGYTPPKDARNHMWWMTIATAPADETLSGETEFTMRPELAEAIELMG